MSRILSISKFINRTNSCLAYLSMEKVYNLKDMLQIVKFTISVFKEIFYHFFNNLMSLSLLHFTQILQTIKPKTFYLSFCFMFVLYNWRLEGMGWGGAGVLLIKEKKSQRTCIYYRTKCLQSLFVMVFRQKESKVLFVQTVSFEMQGILLRW